MNWRQRRTRWQQGWLARRIPPARQITLQGRCLFILPTRLGLWYLLVMLAIYLLGTNYQNNLVLLVAYGLGSLFMVTMWLTHRNLLGLSLLGARRAGRGWPPPMPITVRSERPLQALQFSLNEGRLWLAQVDAVPQPCSCRCWAPARTPAAGEAAGGESLPPRPVSLLDAAGPATGGLARSGPEYGPLRGRQQPIRRAIGAAHRPRWGTSTCCGPTRAGSR